MGALSSVPSQPPTVAFETEHGESELLITHVSGDPLDPDRLSVRGGTIRDHGAGPVTAGDEIAVSPSEDRVRLVWEGDRETSSVLTTVDAEGVRSHRTRVPEFSRSQYEFFRNRNLSDPFFFDVQARTADGDPVTGNVSLEVEVSDHHGSFNRTPETSYFESLVVDFDDRGTATLELGNSPGADVDYWGLDVNEITETVEVRSGNVDFTLYLVDTRNETTG